ncbi:MAG TPA: hypothetical protein VFK88_02090 [Gallionella sp.]|nr:hypothetical protein [Gallionella sp.]
MGISEAQLGTIETSVSALLASGAPLVPELRSQFPEFTFVCCAQGDMDTQPYRLGDGYQLYLINRKSLCINLTDSLEQADGVVVAV